MRLRTQTLLVGLLSLAVPLIGWYSIKQLHDSQLQARVERQTLRAGALTHALRETPAVTRRLAIGEHHADVASWFAETARWPLFVDGYADDWQELSGSPVNVVAHDDELFTLSYRCARRASSLYLFIKVRDATVTHHVPPLLDPDAGENESPDPRMLLANGDTVEMLVQQPDGVTEHALFSVIAPGPVDVVHAADTDRSTAGSSIARWQAAWINVPDGYQLEIELPLPAVGSRIAIAAVDSAQTNAGTSDVVAGTVAARDGEAMQTASMEATGVDATAVVARAMEAPEAESMAVDVEAVQGRTVAAVADARSQQSWVGTLSPERMSALAASAAIAEPAALRDVGVLYHESDTVLGLLKSWTVAGTRARVFDAAGRLTADVNELYSPLPAGDEPARSPAAKVLDAVLFRLFAWLAAGDLPLFPETEKRRQPLHLDIGRRENIDATRPTTRYVTVDNDRLLGTLLSLDGAGIDRSRGYLLFESNEEHVSAVASSPLARLFALLALVTLVIGSLLFGWAMRLSLRITRLSVRASRAIDRDGRDKRAAPRVGSGAKDEIGDLSRNLEALLARSAAHSRYLESLSEHLSDELDTPLSIVRASIENVDRHKLDGETRRLLDRASGGADRLGGIVRALLEANRLEQSVQHAEFVSLSLASWLEDAARDYAKNHPAHRFRVALALSELDKPGSAANAPSPTTRARIAPVLLRQALDKLVENACEFATDRDIVLLLTPGTPTGLAVANRGAPLSSREISLLFTPPGVPLFRRPVGQPDDTDRNGGGDGNRDGDWNGNVDGRENVDGNGNGNGTGNSNSNSNMDMDGRGDRQGDGHGEGRFGLHLVRLVAEAHDGIPVAFSTPSRDSADAWLIVGMSLPAR